VTKLPQISGRDCVWVFEKAGFCVVRQQGSHIIRRRDSPFARLVIPNHKTLKKGMLKAIITDAGLTVDEFVALINK
jgi:predicted RNA binding protein YcfA (HicA-like mRNA interferase family)